MFVFSVGAELNFLLYSFCSQNPKVKMLEKAKDLPAVKDMLEKSKTVLGYDILDICLNGPEDKLEETRYCQPALFIGGLAGLEKLREERAEAVDRASVMAGLSLGRSLFGPHKQANKKASKQAFVVGQKRKQTKGSLFIVVIVISNKKLLVARGTTTSSKKLLVTRHLTTSNKKLQETQLFRVTFLRSFFPPGEYTALCAAGVMSFEDGLKLVKLRGEAMQEAATPLDLQLELLVTRSYY